MRKVVSAVSVLGLASALFGCGSDSNPAGLGMTTAGTGSGGQSGGMNGGGSSNGGANDTGGSANPGGSSNAGTGNAGGSAGAAGSGGSDPGMPAVRFVGRMDTRDAAGPRFAWSGSGVIARFSGTSVGVRLTGGQQYTVLVDGQLNPKLIPSGDVSPIASDLPAGEHIVELYRRTEASQGESQFLGFDFGDGTLLPPPPAPGRRIEVIGDSITCGYGNEGPNMSCPFSQDTENHYLTYAAISARELGADLVTVAWSGKGMVCNYGDDPSSCTSPLPDFYDLALPNDAASAWDFQTYQPDAVVINLGTNDFSTDQDPTQPQFEDAYEAFLERLRSNYPNAWLLCTVAPMLGGSDLATAQTYIDNAIARRHDLGDTKVKAFEMAAVDPDDGYGCDWHPNLTTHEKMAVELSAELRATLDW